MGRLSMGAIAAHVPILFLVTTIAVGGAVQSASGQTIVLRVDGTKKSDSPAQFAAQNGTSWATAFAFLQDALAWIEDEDIIIDTTTVQIWIRGAPDSQLLDGTGAPTALYEQLAQYPDEEWEPGLPGVVDTDDPDSTFILPRNVWLCGGFVGTETSYDQRAPETVRSILSGHIDRVADPDVAFAYTVVTASTFGPSVRFAALRGVTVEDGQATTTGTYSSALRTQQTAGAYDVLGPSFAARSTFRRNRALSGAVSVAGIGISSGGAPEGDPTFYSCRFIENVAEGTASDGAGTLILDGGGVLVANPILGGDAAAEFVNCLFLRNSTLDSANGGVLRVLGSGGATFTNCTADGNHADGQGGFAYVSPDGSGLCAGSTLVNSILWTNTDGDLNTLDFDEEVRIIGTDPKDAAVAISHSLVRGILDVDEYDEIALANLDTDPLFVDSSTDDYRLTHDSPALDAGRTLSVATDLFDIDDDGSTSDFAPELSMFRRIQESGGDSGCQVDMGTFERWHRSDFNGDFEVGFDDLLILLTDWGLSCDVDAVQGCADSSANGTVDFADLLLVLFDWAESIDCESTQGFVGGSPPESIGDCIDRLGTSDPQALAACIEAMMKVEQGQ